MPETEVQDPLINDMPPRARSPLPLGPEQTGGQTLKEYDPELYEAWSKHIQGGFDKNSEMFKTILNGFMNPYKLTILMYLILFCIGILAFVASIILAYTADSTTEALGVAAIFGGLGVVAFLSYFLSRPLQALEENLQYITWLGIVYNTYWTRLTHATDAATFQTELEDASTDAINSIKEMLDKHAAQSQNRPGLR